MCKDQHSDFSDAHPTGPSVWHWKPRGLRWGQGETPHQQAQPQICVCHTFHSPVFAVLCAGSSGWSALPEAQPWAAQLALALSDQGELLAPPPTATALPLSPKHEQNNSHIVFIKDFPANTVQKGQSSPLHLVPGDNLSPGQQDCTELYFCSLAESTYWKRKGGKIFTTLTLFCNAHFPCVWWKNVLKESTHGISAQTILQHSSSTQIIVTIRRKSFSQRTLHPQGQLKVTFLTLYLLSYSFILSNTTTQYLFKIWHAQRLWKELYPLR